MQVAFEKGGEMLQQAGLAVHPKKRSRDSKHAAPLGREVLGVVGCVGAERLRRVAMADVSVLHASSQYTTGALLR
eukprot:7703422-Alexandrium_andersonii.AAC.1